MSEQSQTTVPARSEHIVLVGGDDEYRSEQVIPALAAILRAHHGFRTTVLLATDPATGEVDPGCQTNIPGTEAIDTADLLVLFIRFRELPDEQMARIERYLASGKPIVGLRTATHGFNFSRNPQSAYARYSFRSEVPGWEGGFGRRYLGETWVDHHGEHGVQGTRALRQGIGPAADHPILRGVGDIWTPTDVYALRDLNGPADVLLWGAVTAGMDPSTPIVTDKALMPVAWTRDYPAETGTGRAFATTMGSAQDFTCTDFRRLVVNACYWGLGLSGEIGPEAAVDLVGSYEPEKFGFR